MSDEEKYREIMQRLLEAQQVEPAAKAWESTSSYLEMQRKKKRRRLLIWIIFSGLLLPALWLLMMSDPAKKDAASYVAEKTPQSSQNITAAGTRPSGKGASENARTVPAPQASGKVQAKEPEPHAATISKTTPGVNETSKPVAGKPVHDLTTAKANEIKQESPTQTNIKKQSNARTTIPREAAKEETLASGKSPLESNSKTADTLRETEKPGAVLQAPSLISQVKDAEPPSSQEPHDKDSLIVTSKEQTAVKDSSLTHKKDSVALAASMVTAIPDSVKPQLPPAPYLALEAGLGYFPDWSALSHAEASFIQPVLGLSFNKCIEKKLLFSMGICYYRLSDVHLTTVTSSTTSYGYGEESSVAEVTPLRMHYITVPLRLGWQLNARHSLWAGCNFSYLFGVEAKVERYKSQMGNTSDHSSYIARGYTEGFSMFDPQLALLYRYNLLRSFALQAEFAYGLRDLKQDGFFNVQRDERSMGIKLCFIYTLAHLGR